MLFHEQNAAKDARLKRNGQTCPSSAFTSEQWNEKPVKNHNCMFDILCLHDNDRLKAAAIFFD